MEWVDWPVNLCTGYGLPPIVPDTKLYDAFTYGVTPSLDGSYLLAYGGDQNGGGVWGGICEVPLDGGTPRTVVSASSLPMAIQTVEPHPHLTGLYALGGSRSATCETCAPRGVYLVQVEESFGSPFGARRWSTWRTAGDDLERDDIAAFAWGMGRAPMSLAWRLPFRHLYTGTAGGGPWDVVLE